MKNSFLLIGILFLMGCSSNKKQSVQSEIQDGISVIDLSGDLSKVSSLSLSDAAAKIEIVPLEVTDESMLGSIYHLDITDQDIWVHQYKDNYIYRFSRTGKFLNKIGKIGQGPEEYIRIHDFFVDDNSKELYLQTTTPAGLKVYDYDGKFKRIASRRSLDDVCRTVYVQSVLYDNKFFLVQNLAFYDRPTSKDSIWSFALVDSTYQEKKIFKNPAHIGREEEILQHRIDYHKFVNYWKEPFTSVDTYDNQLTLKFPDTDTIYQYNSAKDELIPQYAIFTNEEKGDYGATHAWIRDRSSFDYFCIRHYYPSKDYIYLLGSKGEHLYIYCYDRRDGSIKMQELKSEITEKRFTYGLVLTLQNADKFVLNNDLCGGSFNVDYRSKGKYWIDVLEPGTIDNWININEVKNSKVKDDAQRQRFVSTLENVEEEGNPILVIATLK